MTAVDESVLVVSTSFLSRQGERLGRGFQPGAGPGWLRSIEREGFFVPRQQAEHCDDLKQIILYLVLRYGQSLFVYQRVRATTETRLMNLYSIGLGGHINPVSNRRRGGLLGLNLQRELTEEVQFQGHFSYHLIGTVNDDQSEVGKYHLGLVYLVASATPEVRVRETEKLAGGLLPAAETAAYEPHMESWSALILPDVLRILAAY